MKYILDTNVLVAANRRDSSCSMECSVKSAQRLEELLEDTLVLDLLYAVRTEYQRYANPKGAPGAGDRFLREALRRSPYYVNADLEAIHAAVPERLEDFDANDLKWIGLYNLAAAQRIINSTDSDYLHRQEDFEAEDILVENIHPEELKPAIRP